MSVVETRICKQIGKSFDVMQHELDVLDAISPILGGKKYAIPASSYHPDVSQQWHLARRNERSLYRGTCSLTNKPIITCLDPALGYTVYNFSDRWSDAVDPFAYGVAVDLTKTFSEHYSQLFFAMPQMSLQLSPHMDNCDYSNYGYYGKDCYMSTTPVFAEKCYYSYLPYKCLYDVDGYANSDSQYLYGCVYAINCYTCQHVFYSTGCSASQFLLDCRDCSSCFACVNMSHKKYCFFNEQLDKDAYTQRVEEYLSTHTSDEIHDIFYDFSLRFPKRATRGYGNESSSGDLNYNMHNAYASFDMRDARDVSYSRLGGIQSTDFVRTTLCGMGTRLYDCSGMAEGDSCAWCIGSNACYQVFYSFYCRDCEHCFGCIRLQHKKYCIFNVQYTKEEYEILLAQLIEKIIQTGERGAFFNPAISPFYYNETCAQERFPLTQEQLAQYGWKRKKPSETIYDGNTYVPQDIQYYNSEEADTEALSGTLVCESSGKGYKLIQQELDFYKKFALPIPRKHYEIRYQERFQRWILPRTLYTRICEKSGLEISSPYAPERLEIVWSETAWDKEFLG